MQYIANKIKETINMSLCTFAIASNKINGFSPYKSTKDFFLVIFYIKKQFKICIHKLDTLKINNAKSIFPNDSFANTVQIIVHKGPYITFSYNQLPDTL